MADVKVDNGREQVKREEMAPLTFSKLVDVCVMEDDKADRTCKVFFADVKKRLFAKYLELMQSDWLYLALLGLLMGIFSFGIDVLIELLRHCQNWLFNKVGVGVEEFAVAALLQYFAWVGFTLLLIMSAAAICHTVAPQAVGSGIPEMKTILRGVVLKEYLTFRTLLAKFTGLILSLGCGLPIGKEGPFVHIASILATLLSKLVVSFNSIYKNESRSIEMLAAACAVGVASTYGAPIGGVLFSIEVTSVFFPLRNYWRGFFSTICSAIIFRLLTVWFQQEDTVVAFSRTSFPTEYPFDPKEFFIFAAIGVVCGFGGVLFILFHRKYVQFIGGNKFVQTLLKRNHFIYPAIVTVILASLRCPLGYGQFFAGALSPREALDELFSNFSWNEPIYNSTEYKALIKHWSSDTANIFLVLFLFTFNMFWMTAVAITLPVPSGVFIPIFVTGAAFGRLVGETVAVIFPNGMRTDALTKIVPGAYAIVGASAFAGAVTHSISTSVIVFEITGQFLYILPVILAVLLANAVCIQFQPSIYDSIIKLKRLPYLPKMPPTSSSVHHISVDDIMRRDVKFISLQSNYRELEDLLISMPRLRAFPIVDRPSSLILLGSIARSQLEDLLDAQIGAKVRQTEAKRREYLRSSAKPAQDDINAMPHRKLSMSRKFLSEEDLKNLSKGSKSYHHQHRGSASFVDLQQTPNKKPFFKNVGTKMHTWSEKVKKSLHISSLHGNEIRKEKFLDLDPEERNEWEQIRMTQRLNFDLLSIDPAPFQLVERTSLYKVHALFSLLGLNRAYVTCLGRLVGVVDLRELRSALEKAQSSGTSTRDGRRSSTSSLEEQVVFGTSLGAVLRPSASIPAKMTSLDGRTDRMQSSVARSSRRSSSDLLSTSSSESSDDDGVSVGGGDSEPEDSNDDRVAVTLRKLSARNSRIEKD